MQAHDARALARLLLAHAPASLAAQVTPEGLGAALLEVVQQAEQAWPELSPPLDREAFVRYLAERLQGESIERALSEVRAADLYLACACAGGHAGALGLFEARVLSQVPGHLANMRATPDFADEVRQRLREKFFVGERKITDYSGRGALSGWVRIAALRTALNMKRNMDDRLAGQEGDDPGRLVVPGEDPELDYIRRRYQGEFKAAFQEALQGLPGEQRNLLRLHLVEGLSIDKLGGLFKVNRSTAARWLATARRKVLEETRRLLGERLKLTPTEVQSLAVVLRSQLDMSICRCLKGE